MAARPPTRHSDRGSWEGGYQDAGYPDDGYPRDGYAADRYVTDGYRDDGDPADGHAAGDHAAEGYRGDGYPADGYSGPSRPDAGDQDAGYRAHRSGSYTGRHGGDRGSRDDRRVRGEDGQNWDAERDGWAEDRRGWAGERADWTSERGDPARERDDWSGDRGTRAGQDGRSWDVDVWSWEDEDGPGDGGYRGTGHQGDPTGGAEGNERLTALTGAVLLVLFAAEGVTILSVHQLLTLHFFLGMLIVGPVVLKACSVLYRFVRYYTGAEEYRRKGPPAPLLRMLGPVVLITSVSVLGTGIMLAITGPSGLATWLFLHRASFVLWFGAMTVHVLAYVWRLPQLASGDLASRSGRRANQVLAGRAARWLLLTVSVLTGLLLAVLTIHRVGAWAGFVGLGH